MSLFGSRNRYDVFEFMGDLWAGETHAWTILGVIVAVIFGMAIYHHTTGSDCFSAKRRREGLRRRKKIVWQWKRD